MAKSEAVSFADCSDATRAAGLYLELLKRSLLNQIYLDDELRILYLRDCLLGKDRYDFTVLHDIRNARRAIYEELQAAREIGRFLDRDIHNAAYNHSMIGRRRMDNLHACLDIVRAEGIPGDVAECGVWRGGSCIFMAGYLKVFGINSRRVIVADSFDGLPPPDNPNDANLDLSKRVFPELAVSVETVQENFAAYDLADQNVVFVRGWFKDTLRFAPITQLALLRLDSDLYDSTMETLTALYEKVVPGGIVIVDDYDIPNCRNAIHDFFASRKEAIPVLAIVDWTGVWFRKPTRAGAGDS